MLSTQDYTEPASAAEAVAKYHEGHFLGAQIKVELSHARASIPKAPGTISFHFLRSSYSKIDLLRSLTYFIRGWKIYSSKSSR